jgi:hypothetical protein
LLLTVTASIRLRYRLFGGQTDHCLSVIEETDKPRQASIAFIGEAN